MNKELIDKFNEDEKFLLDVNRWAIKYLAQMEYVCVTFQLPMFKFMTAYIDGLLEEKYIDDEDYFFLEDLIKIVVKSRDEFLNDVEINGFKDQKRIHMIDYFKDDDNGVVVPLYDRKLNKVYEKVMTIGRIK